MSDRLHIVCLDAPAPPNYGGAIDMYYKIVALAAAGKKITLHYFDYKKDRNAQALEPYCTAIHAYPRKGFIGPGFFSQPFIVRSRINEELIGRLNGDEDPVLLEGLHCSGLLPRLKNTARAVLRMHNEEAAYYRRLVPTEQSFLKKLYLAQESRLLHRHYQRLPKDLSLACLAQTDMEVLQKDYGFTNLHFIPCFIPWQEPGMKTDRGTYCLYHGNLAVPENEAAALWLIDEVWPALDKPLVIAGNNPSPRLVHRCAGHPHVKLETNPSLQRIDELVQEAQLHVLPSMNSTGVKLKLLHALFRGRHCITNGPGIEGSGIVSGVSIANEAGQWKQAVIRLFAQPFTEEDKKNRGQLLAVYDNSLNADRLSALWSHCR